MDIYGTNGQVEAENISEAEYITRDRFVLAPYCG